MTNPFVVTSARDGCQRRDVGFSHFFPTFFFSVQGEDGETNSWSSLKINMSVASTTPWPSVLLRGLTAKASIPLHRPVDGWTHPWCVQVDMVRERPLSYEWKTVLHAWYWTAFPILHQSSVTYFTCRYLEIRWTSNMWFFIPVRLVCSMNGIVFWRKEKAMTVSKPYALWNEMHYQLWKCRNSVSTALISEIEPQTRVISRRILELLLGRLQHLHRRGVSVAFGDLFFQYALARTRQVCEEN